jgi:tetratricopeptide (TPR) repeat protein
MKKNNQKSKPQKKKPSSKANTQNSSDKKKNVFLPLIIAFCIPVLLYMQSLSFTFTYFDDDHLIVDNITFLSNFHNAPQSFLREAFVDNKDGIFYRPLQTLSYMVDIQLSGGNNAWMYHLTNILLLGFISCLLFLLLRKFLIPLKVALLGTLIFCAHPLFISSIAWIPARGDLQLALFSLLSFLFLIEYLQKKKNIFLLFHWIAFSIALFCKETAAFLPFLFIAYYFVYFFQKRIERKHLPIIALYAVSGIFWFWMRYNAIGNYSNPNDTVGFMALLMNIRTIPESVSMFIIPFGIDAFPSFSLFKTFAGSAIIILIIVIFFRNKERPAQEKIFCFIWFLFLLLPTMFYKNLLIDYLNHRFLLPLIGILLFVLFSFPKKWFVKSDLKLSAVMIAVLILLACSTVVKSLSYSDPMTFYKSATEQDSGSAIPFFNMGNMIKSNKGNFQDAINNYTKAIEINPDYAEAYNNRGNTYLQLGSYDLALNDYLNAIRLKPDYTEAYYDCGNLYSSQGLYDKAITNYSKAIELEPDHFKAFNNRGFAYFKQELLDKSIEDYTKAVELNPDYARAFVNRGNAYYKKGLNDNACQDFKKAEELGASEGKKNQDIFCK